jgi:hypothetical protein
MNNQIEAALAADAKQAIMQKLASVGADLPFLIHLNPDDQASMQLLADGRRPFVARAIEIAQMNPEANPGEALTQSALKDMNLFNDLESIERELRRLTEMVRDTRLIAGAEAYEYARIVYKKVKLAEALETPGMKTLLEDLGRLYKPNRASAPEKGGQ